MNQRLKQWVKDTSAQEIRKKHLFFLLPESNEASALKAKLSRIDHLLEHGLILKDSSTTTAGVSSISTECDPVFLKRTNNKGLKFTIKYLFRRGRAFRAAIAAEELRKIGIETPRVLGVGERRFGRILLASYLITETSTEYYPVNKLFKENNPPERLLEQFLEPGMAIAAKLHRAKICHGDLKLANFFVIAPNEDSDWNLGLWDLDAVTKYPNGIPKEKQIKELARIASSFFILADRDKTVPDSFFSVSNLVAKLLDAYKKADPGMPVPEVCEVAAFSKEHWLSRVSFYHNISE